MDSDDSGAVPPPNPKPLWPSPYITKIPIGHEMVFPTLCQNPHTDRANLYKPAFQLGGIITNNIKRSTCYKDLTPCQAAAVKRYQKVYKDGSRSTGDDETDIRELFYLFDGLFFFNMLRCHVRFVFKEEVTDHTKAEHIAITYFRKKDYYCDVYIRHDCTWKGLSEPMLHEMLHAFIDMHIEPGSDLDGVYNSVCGHGKIFQDASLALENASAIHFRHTIELNRDSAMDSEIWYRMQQQGIYYPDEVDSWLAKNGKKYGFTEQQFDEWEFDLDEFVSLLKRKLQRKLDFYQKHEPP